MSRTFARVAFLLSLALAAPSEGGTLATPLVTAKTGDAVTCTIVNVGAKTARAVRAELILFQFFASPEGHVESSMGPADLLPLRTLGVTLAVAGGYVCRFTFSGSGKSLRGSAVVKNGADVLENQPAR